MEEFTGRSYNGRVHWPQLQWKSSLAAVTMEEFTGRSYNGRVHWPQLQWKSSLAAVTMDFAFYSSVLRNSINRDQVKGSLFVVSTDVFIPLCSNVSSTVKKILFQTITAATQTFSEQQYLYKMHLDLVYSCMMY